MAANYPLPQRVVNTTLIKITQEILFANSATFGGKGYFAVDGTSVMHS